MSRKNEGGRNNGGYGLLASIVIATALSFASPGCVDSKPERAAAQEAFIKKESIAGTVEEVRFSGPGSVIGTGGDFDGQGLRVTDRKSTLMFTFRADSDQKIWSVICESNPFSAGYGDIETLGLQLMKGTRVQMPKRMPYGR